MKQVAGKGIAAPADRGNDASRAVQRVADSAGSYFVQPVIKATEVSIADVVVSGVDSSGPVDDFVYLDIGSVDRERKVFVEQKCVSLGDAPSRARQLVLAGDVLVSMTRPNLNAVAQVTKELDGAIASTGFHVLRSPWLEPGFLYYLVQTDGFVDAMCSVVQGALYPAVRPRDIDGFRFNLPPRAEQTRIVEKLEELLSDLDAGVAELKAAHAKLAQYRQSLLKAAVEGALTADWRAARQANIETPTPSFPRKRESIGFKPPATMDSRFRGNDDQGDVVLRPETGADLLQRILTERRARWETRQLAKFAEQGKTPPKDWKAKYPEPVVPDTTDLPALPEGWVWATGGMLFAWGSGDFLPTTAQRGGSFPIYGGNGITGTHDEANVHGGTVVVGRVGVHCGNVYLASSKCWVTDNAIYATSKLDAITWEYAELALSAARLGRNAKGGAQPFVSQRTLDDALIPLPSLVEQGAIIEQLDTTVAAVKQQQAAIEKGLRQSAAQRKNILKAAFAGQLVPQDPNDEPASVLLERIRSARVAAAVSSAAKRGGRKLKVRP